MKKLTSMYKRYMFHPILYKTVTRTSIVAVLMLLWQRYVSDGTFTIWEAPGFLCGVVLLIWAWVDYLRLDGVTIHHLLEEFKGMGKRQKKIHSTRSIIDYADEKIVSFEELEPEERTYCSLLSNLVLGLPLVAAAAVPHPHLCVREQDGPARPGQGSASDPAEPSVGGWLCGFWGRAGRPGRGAGSLR